jgi:hypothetical protein
MFAGKVGVKDLSGVPIFGRLLALPTNIRLGWKSLLGLNTPAYYEHL